MALTQVTDQIESDVVSVRWVCQTDLGQGDVAAA